MLLNSIQNREKHEELNEESKLNLFLESKKGKKSYFSNSIND